MGGDQSTQIQHCLDRLRGGDPSARDDLIRDKIAPPTINLDDPSVKTPIDLVPHRAKPREIDTVLSNSFGFGGTNASLVLRRAA